MQHKVLETTAPEPELSPVQLNAAFSLDVYYDGSGPYLLPKNWERLFTSKQMGVTGNHYRGVCYAKKINGFITQLIIAHRGTSLRDFGESYDYIKEGFIQAIGLIPNQVEMACLFTDKVIDMLLKHDEWIGPYSRPSITHTGHSFGAVLAQITSALYPHLKSELFPDGHCFEKFNVTLASYVFDSPGIKPIINNVLRIRNLSNEVKQSIEAFAKAYEVYLADVNIINSCNKQLGKVHRPTKYSYDYEVSGKIPEFPPSGHYQLNPYYFIYYSINDQHPMQKMYEYLLNNVPAYAFYEEKESDNPKDLAAGYYLYLDGVQRQNYWRGYFKSVWDHHPEVHNKYGNDLNNYISECFIKLKEIHDSCKPTSAHSSSLGMFAQPQSIEIDGVEFEMINISESDSSKTSDITPNKSMCLTM